AWTFSNERGGYELAGLDTGRHVVTVELPFSGVWGETVEMDTTSAVQGMANFVITTDVALTGREEQTTDAVLSLDVPSPNPARGAVVVRYALAEAQPVTLRLYDALGRTVATVDAGMRAAGAHAVSFDASSLAPGVYVVRLDADGTRTARTFVVAR
ncbi:MAG TPA: T9SS type A sorting domain-containing protein, partial [Rhodothermales bacterium]|nr:T9SS type A sorting domain-containing protein [Rhodothermales bacterium]